MAAEKKTVKKISVHKFKTYELSDLVDPTTGHKIKVGAVTHRATLSGTNVEEVADTVEELAKTQVFDVIVCPEYSFMRSKIILEAYKKENIIARMHKISRDYKCLIIADYVWSAGQYLHHAAYGIEKGKVLVECYKSTDIGEGNVARSHFLSLFRKESSGEFMWKGYRCLLEVGADFGRYLSRNPDANASTAATKDLHFHVSSGCFFLESKAVRPGGYLVCVDGFDSSVHVTQQK